jgi:hypothetical protein
MIGQNNIWMRLLKISLYPFGLLFIALLIIRNKIPARASSLIGY